MAEKSHTIVALCPQCERLHFLGSQWTANKKHGGSSTKLYRKWAAMKVRCSPRADHRQTRGYYDRGIRVCEEWQTFEPFQKWALANGYYPGAELDRIDNDGDYSPKNCRFVSKSENCRNRRTNVLVTYRGRTQTLADWVDELGLNYNRVRGRILKGWDPEKAFGDDVRGQLEAFGRSQSCSEWAKEYGLSVSGLQRRMARQGLSLEQALTERNRCAPIEAFGRKQSLSAWAKEFGIRPETIRLRMQNHGLSAEDAISLPARKGKPVGLRSITNA